MKTAVALIIFNRAETTQLVFNAIRQAKPAKLLVIADGPRATHPDDAARCAAARAVIEQVDWECEVLKNYSETNLGCGLRPATGISWVFEQVEEAIILEDDCLPHPSFFQFCEELLAHYRHDARVMHISGNNFQQVQPRTDYSYSFSRYPHIWGWASWRRAWNCFDFELKAWAAVRDGAWLEDYLGNEHHARFWSSEFERVYGADKSHIWDYQWTYACFTQNGLSINPNVNLVSNIGFTQGATHTVSDVVDQRNNLPTHAITLPLNHPPFMMRDAKADEFTQTHIFTPNRMMRARRKLKRVLQQLPV